MKALEELRAMYNDVKYIDSKEKIEVAANICKMLNIDFQVDIDELSVQLSIENVDYYFAIIIPNINYYRIILDYMGELQEMRRYDNLTTMVKDVKYIIKYYNLPNEFYNFGAN